jgi:hypothetical protein
MRMKAGTETPGFSMVSSDWHAPESTAKIRSNPPSLFSNNWMLLVPDDSLKRHAQTAVAPGAVSCAAIVVYSAST